MEPRTTYGGWFLLRFGSAVGVADASEELTFILCFIEQPFCCGVLESFFAPSTPYALHRAFNLNPPRNYIER